jgi:anti-sigma factor RsiW
MGDMDLDSQLKLQAYLDGELSEAEGRAVANWLAKDSEAVALHAELRNTRKALVGFEIGITLPESREFFWSKIEREILRQEQPQASPQSVPFFARLHRFLMPASAVAALVLAALLVNGQFGLLSGSAGGENQSSLDDAGALTYHDYAARTTLVWLSYPAQNEFAQDDSPDTLPQE